MAAITIQGHRFEVPEGVLARYQIGTPLQTEGEVSTIRQVLCENLRNNFANKVKAKNGEGDIPADQLDALQSEFNEYAEKYQFGVRAVGGGTGVRRAADPVEREMRKLARDDVTRAYMAKFGEKPGKDWVAEKAEELMDKRHDDLAKRAKAILRQREQVADQDATAQALGL